MAADRFLIMRLLMKLALLSAILGIGLLSGCSTTQEHDSDLPWNMPQGWEGSPYIPGLNEGL